MGVLRVKKILKKNHNFCLFLRFLLKVNKVTTEHQKWSKNGQNSLINRFLLAGQSKPRLKAITFSESVSIKGACRTALASPGVWMADKTDFLITPLKSGFNTVRLHWSKTGICSVLILGQVWASYSPPF